LSPVRGNNVVPRNGDNIGYY